MTRSYVIFLALSAVSLVAVADVAMTHNVVDLDLPACRRWIPSLDAVLNTAQGAAGLANILQTTDSIYTAKGCLEDCRARLVRVLRARWPTRYQEMTSTAAYLRAHPSALFPSVTADTLAAVSFIYELHLASPVKTVTTRQVDDAEIFGCTAIVGCRADGKTVHARNLDWTPVAPYGNVTAEFEFVRGRGRRTTMFKTIDFLMADGGTVTGAKVGVAISLNARKNTVPLDELLRCLETPGVSAPVRMVIRDVLEAPGLGYAQMVRYWNVTKTCSSFYLAISGPRPGQGAVLTKSGPLTPDPEIPVRPLSCQEDNWFVAQTNFDAWKPQPPNDLRLHRVSDWLNEKGRSVGTSVEGLWNALSILDDPVSRGVYNNKTVFTVVLDPEYGNMVKSAVRDPVVYPF